MAEGQSKPRDPYVIATTCGCGAESSVRIGQKDPWPKSICCWKCGSSLPVSQAKDGDAPEAQASANIRRICLSTHIEESFDNSRTLKNAAGVVTLCRASPEYLAARHSYVGRRLAILKARGWLNPEFKLPPKFLESI